MALRDRLEPLCDLLLGAAYADDHLADREEDAVREVLEELAGELTPALEKRIAAFDAKAFELESACAAFRGDSEDDRKKVLALVARLEEADDEIDFAEDDYLRAVAAALKLPESALAGLTVDIEPDKAERAPAKPTKPPPAPAPKKK